MFKLLSTMLVALMLLVFAQDVQAHKKPGPRQIAFQKRLAQRNAVQRMRRQHFRVNYYYAPFYGGYGYWPRHYIPQQPPIYRYGPYGVNRFILYGY